MSRYMSPEVDDKCVPLRCTGVPDRASRIGSFLEAYGDLLADDEGWSVELGHGDPVFLHGLRDLPEEPPAPPEVKATVALQVPRSAFAPAHDGSLDRETAEASWIREHRGLPRVRPRS